MQLRHLIIWLCEACLSGDGSHCNTPGCALCRSIAPDIEIAPELYQVINERKEGN